MENEADKNKLLHGTKKVGRKPTNKPAANLRQEQVRAAQKAFIERKKNHVVTLENRVAELEAQLAQATQAQITLGAENTLLRSLVSASSTSTTSASSTASTIQQLPAPIPLQIGESQLPLGHPTLRHSHALYPPYPQYPPLNSAPSLVIAKQQQTDPQSFTATSTFNLNSFSIDMDFDMDLDMHAFLASLQSQSENLMGFATPQQRLQQQQLLLPNTEIAGGAGSHLIADLALSSAEFAFQNQNPNNFSFLDTLPAFPQAPTAPATSSFLPYTQSFPTFSSSSASLDSSTSPSASPQNQNPSPVSIPPETPLSSDALHSHPQEKNEEKQQKDGVKTTSVGTQSEDFTVPFRLFDRHDHYHHNHDRHSLDQCNHMHHDNDNDVAEGSSSFRHDARGGGRGPARLTLRVKFLESNLKSVPSLKRQESLIDKLLELYTKIIGEKMRRFHQSGETQDHEIGHCPFGSTNGGQESGSCTVKTASTAMDLDLTKNVIDKQKTVAVDGDGKNCCSYRGLPFTPNPNPIFANPDALRPFDNSSENTATSTSSFNKKSSSSSSENSISVANLHDEIQRIKEVLLKSCDPDDEVRVQQLLKKPAKGKFGGRGRAGRGGYRFNHSPFEHGSFGYDHGPFSHDHDPFSHDHGFFEQDRHKFEHTGHGDYDGHSYDHEELEHSHSQVSSKQSPKENEAHCESEDGTGSEKKQIQPDQIQEECHKFCQKHQNDGS
ncbi:hypothetical protein HK100_011600 [Physocladia obscura]|uniref:BZIP domain-containing protein n=1 Tax=Physocladia obscura TaxID=109957 RepID=A0AAD5T122_9FUNG|nr:hypothetical protein HK100_011600 [Physocladia obscura]